MGNEKVYRGTTVLAVRRRGSLAMGCDGQVSLGDTIVKSRAVKIRTMAEGRILAGFAGSVADALTLFEKFEGKLESFSGNTARAVVELARDWRMDRMLRRLEAILIVGDRERLFLLSGSGEVIEPDDDVLGVGSGGQYAAAAAAMTAGAATLGAGAQETSEGVHLPKAIQYSMLPGDLSDAEKFRMARSCGFEGVEAVTMESVDAATRLGDLAREAGTPVHSMTFGGWGAPLSSPDPEVIKQGLTDLELALRCTKAMGGEVVLLVPAVVNESVRYVEAYERSQKHIRTLLPLAEELGIVIAVENVWNNFLLSPIEFARYVDEFESPWLKAYFDVGNVVAFGWPQDWIRTLDDRIARVHLKDFKRDGREWTNLGEGDVNWPEIRASLVDEVGYATWITPELPSGDEEYLRDLVARIDRLIALPPGA